MKAHPAAELFPMLPPDELRALADDIAQHGQLYPIILLDGAILDGRNRHAACQLAGVTPRFEDYDGDSPTAYVISANLKRRNLTTAQQADLGLELIPLFEEEARESQKRKPLDSVLANLPKQNEPIHARDLAAKAVGISSRTIGEAALLKKADPVIYAAAKAAAFKTPDARDITLGRLKHEITTARNALIPAVPPPTGLYRTIVIDPPWPMQKIEREVRQNQVAFDYPTMSEEELAALPIPAADDCHVFLWTTHKFLPMALRLLDAWGMKYVLTMVWHKPGGFQPIGLPQYNCEFAVYARKGTPTFAETKAFNACFNAPRTEHSAKPEEFYDVIRRVTAGPRIDMFNRRAIEGFDVWGNQA